MNNDDEIPLSDVLKRFNVSRQSIWRWIRNGDFPRPLNIPNRRPRVWLRQVLDVYQKSLISGRDWRVEVDKLLDSYEKNMDLADN